MVERKWKPTSDSHHHGKRPTSNNVALESAFSFGDKVLPERRTQLAPESFKVCIYLKDYLDSYDRIQDTSLEENLSYVDEEIVVEEGNTYSGIHH